VREKRGTRLLLAAGTVAVMVGGSVVAMTSTAGAAGGATLTVGVGGDTTVHGVGFEGMRFDAPTLTVHKGDTLNFQFQGFHTATLIPAGVNATDWRAANQGPGGAFALIQPDLDDSPPAFEFNKAVLFPSDGTCGTSGNPCAYDGNSVVNSGAPLSANSFSVTVNANPGQSFWVLCLVHDMMQLQVNVVANNTAATTQAAINSFASSTLAADHAQAAALVPKLEHQSGHKTKSGKVWDAFAGFDGDGWGLDGMFPSALHIKKGQRVQWHFAQLTGNIHTVTFPRKSAIAFEKDFSGGNMKCEGTPDTAVNAAPPAFCNPGGMGSLEVEIPSAAVVTVGTHSYSGHGLRSSGVRGQATGNVAPYTLKFTKKTGKHGFRYACNIHGGMMSGRVFVR